MKKQKLTLLLLLISEFCISQISNMPIWEQVSFSTVKLQGINNSNISISQGTGFFFSFRKDNLEALVLVTNKHVVKNTTKGFFTFNRKKNDCPDYGKVVKFDMNWQNRWIMHKDTNVDICILPFTPILQEIQKNNDSIFIISIPEDFIPIDSLWNTMNIMEEIAMIGYPNGLIDTTNNLPIARKGITASAPKIDFMGTKEFAIDVPVFAGSSGSPVFLVRKPLESNIKGNILSLGINEKIYLIGINYAVHTHDTYSNIYNGSTRIQNIYAKNLEQIEIGRAVKSSQLLYFKDLLFNK